ncbi:MAG: DEAD/DEAH box helicase [Bradymonadaceae bacterium]
MAAGRRSEGEIRSLVEKWKRGSGLGKHFTNIERVPEQGAEFGEFPDRLDGRLAEALERRGIDQLYTHQTEAIEHVLDGDHTVVVTPTASGKTLCYNLPVLDSMYRDGSALYLFPTKALSQDQSSELNELIEDAPGLGRAVEGQVYDGDTPSDVRRRIRRQGRLVLTNPDMLHAGILPHHDKWAGFFRSLEYVVVDEIHSYRGVFGCHVGNVMRRLRRICAHYGAEPTFVSTSATIANPAELAGTLTGLDFEVVDDNGAPTSEKYVCFMNPPIVDAEQMRRQSPLTAAQKAARRLLKRDCGTIVFARSRRSVEVVLHRLEDKLERDREAGDLHERIAGYRGGYLPDMRRSIEKGLREETLKGVVSTNALELGIDIGSLDVCVQAGYPGTVASTWQQIGRAGRDEGTSLAILIASDLPVDQFIVQHPDYFLGKNPEEARVDPGNLLIASEHLKCAAYELPLRDGEAFGELSAEETRQTLEYLAAEAGIVRRSGDSWKWVADTYPASDINLRDIDEENFAVVDETRGEPEVIAEVDFESAHKELYPNAVYQVGGEPYRVERLDYDERRAYVERSDDGYYTTATHYSSVHVLDVFEEESAAPGRIHFGEVRVSDRWVGYKKIKFETGENIGYGDIELPELDLHTMAYWLKLPTENFPKLSRDSEQWARMLQGLGEVLKTAASLRLMCDPRDLDTCIGSTTQDRWLSEGFEGLTLRDSEGDKHTFESDAPVEAESHEVEDSRVGPVLYDPSVFVYDCYPGGVGFGEGLYDNHRAFMERALDVVDGCDCEEGCPSCVGPPDPDLPEVKGSVRKALSKLAYLN